MRTFRIGCLPFSEQTPSAENGVWLFPPGKVGLRKDDNRVTKNFSLIFVTESLLNQWQIDASLGKIMGKCFGN